MHLFLDGFKLSWFFHYYLHLLPREQITSEDVAEGYETFEQDRLLYKYLLLLLAVLVAVIAFYHYSIASSFARRPLGKKSELDIRCDESADGYDPDTGLLPKPESEASPTQPPIRRDSSGLPLDSPRKTKDSTSEPGPIELCGVEHRWDNKETR